MAALDELHCTVWQRSFICVEGEKDCTSSQEADAGHTSRASPSARIERIALSLEPPADPSIRTRLTGPVGGGARDIKNAPKSKNLSHSVHVPRGHV